MQKSRNDAHMTHLVQLIFMLWSSYTENDLNVSMKVLHKIQHALNGNQFQNKSRWANVNPKPSSQTIDYDDDDCTSMKENTARPAHNAQQRQAVMTPLQLAMQDAYTLGLAKPPEPKIEKETIDVQYTKKTNPSQRPTMLPPLASNQTIQAFVLDRIAKKGLLSYEGRLIIYVYPDAFEFDDYPLPQYVPDKGERKPTTTSQPTGRAQSNTSGSLTQADRQAQREKKERSDSEALEAAANWNATVLRLGLKLRKNDDTAVHWYDTHPESKDFRQLVLEAAWGKEWLLQTKMTSTQWILYCKIKGFSRELMMLKLLELFPEWRATQTLGAAATWHAVTGKLWHDSTLVLEAERAQHNQEVHAANGNTMSRAGPFCLTQTDVNSRAETMSFYDNTMERAMKYFRGSKLALRLATEPSSTNATQQNNPANSIFRGDIVQSNNVVVLKTGLPMVVTPLIPRQVRNGPGAALINTLIPLFTRTLGPTNFKVGILTPTELTMVLEKAAIMANQNLGRADNTNLGGWNAIDLAWLARIQSYIGLCMDQAIIKLIFLHDILSWAQPYNTLPLTAVGVIDQNTQPDPAGAVILGYDNINTNAFNENLGGNLPTLAFNGGANGTIGFHLTIETVPIARRALALWIPATILLQDQSFNVGLALAFFIQMWAPWPTGIWSLLINTLDSAGGNAAQQLFAHMSSLVQVPGMTDFDIILPRRTTAVNPTDQPRANNLAILQPITGPTPCGGGGLGANQALNVNFVGQPAYQTYDLAQFMYTWALGMSQTELANFIQRLSYTTGIGPSIERCLDLVANTSQVYPMMISDAVNVDVVWAPNSVQQFASSNAMGVSNEPVQQVWPQPGGNRSDFLINATEVVAWNKVATGLCTSTEGCESGFVLDETIGNFNNAYWSILRSMAFAVTWCSHRLNVGWGGNIWDTAYSNTSQAAFRENIRKYYNTVSNDNRAPSNSGYGKMLAGYFAKVIGNRLGFNPPGGDNITIFDYICPPTGSYQIVLSHGGNVLENVIPINLPDLWMQLFAEFLPKWQSTIPLPQGPDSAEGYYAGLTSMRIPGNQFRGGLCNPEYYKQTLDDNETADFTDDVRWNERLMYLEATAIPSFVNGVPLLDTNPVNFYPKQRTMVQTNFMPNIATGVVSSSTMSNPNCDLNGSIVYAVGTVNNVLQTKEALYKRVKLSIEGWQVGNMIAWKTDTNQGPEKNKSRFAKYNNNESTNSNSSSAEASPGESTSVPL